LEIEFKILEQRFAEQSKLYYPESSGPVINFRRETAEGENDHTRDFSNRQLLEAQHKELNRQKDKEERVLGITENIKGHAYGIGDEIDHHNMLLDKLDEDLDDTGGKLDKTTRKVRLLIHKTNDCCLILCVFALIAVLLVLIFAV
jgi:hypothetical protein